MSPNLLLRAAGALALPALLTLAASCGDEEFARVYVIEEMGQTIGGPAAAARPGDYLLENDRLRAVVHGRHNQRSTMPISNGSLIDLDLQRSRHANEVGKGKDAFYELGPMVNLRVSASSTMGQGLCVMNGDTPSVGAAPCPTAGCARVTAAGRGENIMAILGLLDMAIERKYDIKGLEIITDYDVCPGEPLVHVATTARFYGPGEAVEMQELPKQTGLMDVLLGENTGKSCETAADCAPGESCDRLLIELSLGSLNTKMRRCRRPTDKLAGVLAGDFMLFSAKAHVFIPGSGFDNESYIRSLFDSGGDVFSAPLSRPFVAAVGDGVSYAYFNASGQMQIPVFSEAFTASMTNRVACEQAKPDCLKGKELRFRRFVSVGHGDLASALEGYYKVRKIETGRVEGHVIDARTSAPLTRTDVFVFDVPEAWQGLSDEALAAHTLDELTAEHVKKSGEPGVASHFRTDTAANDSVPDGSFDGPLPAGRFLLAVRTEERAASRLVPLRVAAGSTVKTTLLVDPPGTVRYQVQETSGRALPSKLTFGHCFPECARDEDCSGARPRCDTASRLCVPAGGYTGADSCRPDQRWGADPITGKTTCVCPSTGRLPLALGGSRFADGTARVELSTSGSGEVRLEPGDASYQVIVSRGLEYELSRQFVKVRAGVTTPLRASLARVVDTRGWIAADFHVHGPGSVDSGLDHATRIRSYAAEGVELVSASDHDHLTDYAPTIRQLNLAPWVKSQIGLEVSPLDYGHFIGFPLRFDQNQELGGAFHWRVGNPKAGPGEDDWRNLKPGEIFTKLRELGALDPARTVTFAAHFYDYFTFYGVDPWTLEIPIFSITALFNDVLSYRSFSGDFDALEAFNGKNLDVIRRPTYKEIKAYNTQLAAFLESTKTLPYEERQRRWGELSAAAQRDFLERTPEEQAAGLSFSNASFVCRCTSDAECGAPSLCDEATGACISGCASDTSCEATLVAAGREKCLPVGGDAKRTTCQRVTKSCTTEADCTTPWGTPPASEKCLARDPASPTTLTCELACTADKDCKGDAMRPICDTKAKLCVPATVTAAKPVDPCPTVRGTIDDWFQLLNHGVRRPVLGNSDSHGTYGIEAGCPRNYVRSDAGQPMAIAEGEVAAQVKAMRSFATYGPFVELTLNDQPIGSTVKVAKGEPVRLHLKVQSPTWFDVDRIEVYRNGDLIREIKGRTDCPEGSIDCILVPNRQVVNFDGVLTDTPPRDAWYVVAVMGLDGRSLAPVYSTTPVARLGMYELIQRLTPLLPPLRSFRTPLSPSMGIVRPYAVTNPIWVDVGGDGLVPLQAPPSWATPAELGSSSSPLTAPPQAPSHDHRPGLGRLREQAAGQQGDALTAEAIRRALDGLRYSSFSR